MSSSVYLDHNATAPIRPQAVEAVVRALEIGGNPSSIHARGRQARAVMENARGVIAGFVGGETTGVVFTSGGAEANALAIESAVLAGFSPLIIGATEHDTVIETARASGVPVERLPVDANGVADLGWLAARLDGIETRPFVALMMANNETGVIQPVAQAATLVAAAKGWLHVDAIQAAGKIDVDVTSLGAQSLTLSAHKLGGPQGVGALIATDGARVTRRIHGGGQERGARAGTENLGGISGFAAAATASTERLDQTAWRDAAAERLKAAGAVVLGEAVPRLSNTLCVAAPGWPSSLQVIALDLCGVMVSAGSACSSGKVKPSAVVEAMGRPDLAPYVLRASGGWDSTEQDWNRFADAWLEAHARYAARPERAA
jgi:cysteine desulfurase